jgi:hypothetical protein
VEPVAKLRGEVIDLIIAVYLDRPACGIENYFAVGALRSMTTHLFEQLSTDLAVEIVGKLAEKIGAGHAG